MADYVHINTEKLLAVARAEIVAAARAEIGIKRQRGGVRKQENVTCFYPSLVQNIVMSSSLIFLSRSIASSFCFNSLSIASCFSLLSRSSASAFICSICSLSSVFADLSSPISPCRQLPSVAFLGSQL